MSAQQVHHLRVSWNMGGRRWWRQAASWLVAGSYSTWQPYRLQRGLAEAVAPGAAVSLCGTSRTSHRSERALAGTSTVRSVRTSECVKGESSRTCSAKLSPSSGASANFLLYAATKAALTLSTESSSHFAGSVMASLWCAEAGALAWS